MWFYTFVILSGLDKQKINKNFQYNIFHIFLPIIFSICFGCSKELSHSDGSFEYPQHNNFPERSLIWRPGFYSISAVMVVSRVCEEFCCWSG